MSGCGGNCKCKQELPNIERLQAVKLEEGEVLFVTIKVDDIETARNSLERLQEHFAKIFPNNKVLLNINCDLEFKSVKESV